MTEALLSADPAPALEEQAHAHITALGIRINKGPSLNRNRTGKGVYIFSMKAVLSKKQLEAMKIKLEPKDDPSNLRTVRFLGDVIDGTLVSVRHIGSSERKKLGFKTASTRLQKKIREDKRRQKRKKEKARKQPINGTKRPVNAEVVEFAPGSGVIDGQREDLDMVIIRNYIDNYYVEGSPDSPPVDFTNEFWDAANRRMPLLIKTAKRLRGEEAVVEYGLLDPGSMRMAASYLLSN
jgi:hypothetical protein